MQRLRALLPRGKYLFWTVAGVAAGTVVLLLLATIFRIHLTLNLASVLWALALVLVVLVVQGVIRHVQKPTQTVAVGYHLKLEQPMVPMVGRYSFRLEVFYELEEKGDRARVDQGTIELRFKRSDHPELLDWCCTQISEHIAKHSRFAAERYPAARVVLPPDPTPALLKAEVVGGDVLAADLGRPAAPLTKSTDPGASPGA